MEEEHNELRRDLEIERSIPKSGVPKDYEQLGEQNKTLQKALTSRKNEIKELKSLRSNEKRQSANKIKYLDEQLEEVSAELAKAQQIAETDEESNGDDRGQYENAYIQILEAIFPELELAYATSERLYKLPDFFKFLKMLRPIVIDRQSQESRGTKVQRTVDWYKININREWRLYYCNESQLLDGKAVIVIGDKNTQPRDHNWLRANPPESCL